MPEIQTDALGTAGAVFMLVLALGCAGWGGLAVLRPHRPPQPITGPAWLARVWGLSYVLLGVVLAARAVGQLFGEESGWAITLIHGAAGPLMIFSVAVGFACRWRTRRQAGDDADGGRHVRQRRT
ncbi:hypothetical protein RM717_09335 [Streptomyces griseus]|uniref:Integral membrane protein n=1 Tax=Streptomyces stephensoniae TaxID=3375367 RepID=A0ABU2VZM3_9ACTN|nr:hypothetical protein [Streptomyces griseus]MDT0490708.1 hypothetical protein [Streptomyces griseus]